MDKFLQPLLLRGRQLDTTTWLSLFEDSQGLLFDILIILPSW